MKYVLDSIKKPKVSIIVPVYNVEAYIEECVESLINQSLKEIQIVLVDNGSLDGSSKIIQHYASQDNRIEIIKLNINQGMPRARNVGLNVVVGEYIAFVDSDDLCDVTMFDKLYKQAKRFDADIVTCNVLRFIDDWRKGVDHHPEHWYYETERAMPITSCPEQFMEQAAWAKILRREYIENLPYKFTEGSVCCEDVPACTHAFLNTSKIALVNETLYFYRNRPNSLSNHMNYKYTDDFIYAMLEQDKIIHEKGFDDELTLANIVEMRFLLANHIITKMEKRYWKHYFYNIKQVFKTEDRQYLKKFFKVFPDSELLFNAIMTSNLKLYKRVLRLRKSLSKGA